LPDSHTEEHSEWLNAAGIESLLGDALDRARVERSEAEDLSIKVAMQPTPFVALVDSEGRFDTLIDRCRLLDRLTREAAAQSRGRKIRRRGK
jgi:hypothetical protein